MQSGLFHFCIIILSLKALYLYASRLQNNLLLVAVHYTDISVNIQLIEIALMKRNVHGHCLIYFVKFYTILEMYKSPLLKCKSETSCLDFAYKQQMRKVTQSQFVARCHVVDIQLQKIRNSIKQKMNLMSKYDVMKLVLLMILHLRFQLIYATEGNILKLVRLCDSYNYT